MRFTLLIALLPLLALPWIGLRFVERMAELARDSQWETQQAAARSLAASLHERYELFGLGDPATWLPRGIERVIPQPLPMVLPDGDAVEWAGAPRRELPVQLENGAPLQTLRARLAVAESIGEPGRIFLLVEADDERLVLPGDIDTSGDGPVVQPGDQLTVLIGAEEQLLEAIAADQRARAIGSSRILLPEMPQRMPVPLVGTGQGWRAELELPMDARLVRILIADVDYLGSRRVEARADSGLLLVSARAEDLERAAAHRREQQWSEVLRALDRGTGRVSIVGADGELLARHGEVTQPPPQPSDPLSYLARFLLWLAERIGPDELSEPGQSMTPLTSALSGVAGKGAKRVGAGAGMPVWTLTSAHPIWIGDRIAGALLLEDSTAARLSLAQQALERLTLLVGAALAATALALLAVGTLAVSRIVRLRRAAEAAIDARGRVAGAVPRFRLRDEVDALAESYNRVLARLREHQDYLAKLRSRLIHELRTPIMVVRSSLDNLAAETDAGRTSAYAVRAQAGAARLERIVASMGEAGSLEAMLEESELVACDLVALGGSCVEGYRTAYPEARLRFQPEVASARTLAAPESIAQALDKLVGNAVDFAEPGSEIVVAVAAAKQAGGRLWRIAVTNRGPALPAEMADSLFESMVSVRDAGMPGADRRGHLGLGLYLVRLVAEFHGGTAQARNVADGVEVGFTVMAITAPAHGASRSRT